MFMWTNKKVWALPFEPIPFDGLLPRIKLFLSLITIEILFCEFHLAGIGSMYGARDYRQAGCLLNFTNTIFYSIYLGGTETWV